jgi:putative FmdB family regulatory protein
MVYEYVCDACGNTADVEMSVKQMEERPDVRCEQCAGTMRKQISLCMFHLKGHGWASDGYSSTKKESKNDG